MAAASSLNVPGLWLLHSGGRLQKLCCCLEFGTDLDFSAPWPLVSDAGASKPGGDCSVFSLDEIADRYLNVRTARLQYLPHHDLGADPQVPT